MFALKDNTVVLCVLLGTLCAAHECGAQAGALKYGSARELRNAARPLTGKFRSEFEKDEDEDAPRLFMVGYLGAGNAELRDAAVDILAELVYYGRPIRATAFEEYLSAKYPINVRTVALAFSMWNHQSYANDVAWKKLADRWRLILNDIAKCPVSPPHLLAVVQALSFNTYSGEWTQLVAEEHRQILLQRVLALLSYEGTRKLGKPQRRMIAEVSWRFPREEFLTCAVAWYCVEPAAEARRALIDFVCGRVAGNKEEARRVRPLLSLAAKDWVESIAEQARRALE